MNGQVAELDDKSFRNTIIDYKKGEHAKFLIERNTIIEFYMRTCPHCIGMAPIYQEAAENFPDIDFFRVDVNAYSEIADIFKIEGTPTFILLPLKGEPTQAVGQMSLENLSDALKEVFK